MTLLIHQSLSHILDSLRTVPDFFDHEKEQRAQDIIAMKPYLSHVYDLLLDLSEKEFLEQVRIVTRCVKKKESYTSSAQLLRSILEDIHALLFDPTSKQIPSCLQKHISIFHSHKTQTEKVYALYHLYHDLGCAFVPTVRIECASPLSPEVSQKLTKNIQQQYSSLVEPLFLTTPPLLGGIRIFVNGILYDYSVKHKLDHALSTLYSLAS